MGVQDGRLAAKAIHERFMKQGASHGRSEN
jgi:hypothetical protein